MNRREALSRVAFLIGGTVVGAELFLTGCTTQTKIDTQDLFAKSTIAYLNEIGETILPQTSTPGAKAANVGEFMNVFVRDCYEAKDQELFKTGLEKINSNCKSKYGKEFMELEPAQRTEFITKLDAEMRDYNTNKKPEEPSHYFSLIKQLTLLGFFTSEVGCTQALRYLPVPGKYVGDIPYKKGEKAWALG